MGTPIADESGIPIVFEITTDRFSVPLQQLQIVFHGENEERMSFLMSEQDRTKFATFTASAVGERVVVTVCGKVVAEFVVQVQVDSGTGSLTFADSAEAERIRMIAQGDAECPEG